MAYLFEVNNKAVYPTTESLLISPFKEIWERDSSVDKDIALREFSYIEFSSSVKKTNMFREYSPEKRDEELKKEFFKDLPDWQPDELVLEGIRKIEELQKEASLTYRYWQSNVKAAEKIIEFFDEFDLNEKNFKTGNPIYKPKDITSSISDAEKTLATLNSLKKKVEEELFENIKNRGNAEISHFADPSSIDDEDDE